MLQDIVEEVNKQAEQRISSRFIMYVHGGRLYGNSAESHNLKKARDDLVSAKKPGYGTIVERFLEDEQNQCACTNNDTRNPTVMNLTAQHMKGGFTSLLVTNGITTETTTRIVWSCLPYSIVHLFVFRVLFGLYGVVASSLAGL